MLCSSVLVFLLGSPFWIIAHILTYLTPASLSVEDAEAIFGFFVLCCGGV